MGRLPADQRADRRREILAAAMDLVATQGWEATTMADIARAANASKETLYAWFGGRTGLFEELVAAGADRSATAITQALEGDGDHRATLEAYAQSLLAMLTGPQSLAVNRAAMSQPDLAEMLLAQGRHRIGPVVQRWLGSLAERGVLAIDSPAAAFELLYGLVVRDTQIRVLLGEPPPTAVAIQARARTAVDQFLILTTPDGSPGRAATSGRSRAPA